MSVEGPYCPACGCYTRPPGVDEFICCNCYLHTRPLEVRPRWKLQGRHEKRSKTKPLRVRSW